MLDIKGVSVSFDTGRNQRIRVVDGADLSLPDTGITCIIGETGSGKSMLLLSVLGLLPPGACTEGSIVFDGQDLLKLRDKELRRLRGKDISYIPQGNGSAFDPLWRIWSQVAEPLTVRQTVTVREARRRAESMLEAVDFDDGAKWGNLYPHNLSGGMKQRALIAMGIIGQARLILADEPTKGLDDDRRQGIEGIFRSLEQAAILCVTHDLYFAMHTADTVAVMYASQIIEISPAAEFFASPLHPYSRVMTDSLIENGMKYSAGFAPPHTDYGQGCRFAARCSQRRHDCQQNVPMYGTGDRKVRCRLYDRA